MNDIDNAIDIDSMENIWITHFSPFSGFSLLSFLFPVLQNLRYWQNSQTGQT